MRGKSTLTEKEVLGGYWCYIAKNAGIMRTVLQTFLFVYSGYRGKQKSMFLERH